MADEQVTYPRVVYRGKPDVLGQGVHADPVTGELIGETMRAESKQQFDEVLKKDGWRLTREDPDHPDPARQQREQQTKQQRTDAQRLAQPADAGAINPAGVPGVQTKPYTGPNPHASTVPTMQAYINTIDSVAELDEVRALELQHPEYEAGRAGVLQLIDQRRAKLTNG